MSYRHTIQAGIENLQDIEQLLKGFQDQHHIPAIELDLAMQKARNLYDVLMMLKQISPVTTDTMPKKKSEIIPPQESTISKNEIITNLSQADIEIPVSKKTHEKEAQILSDRFASRVSIYDSIHQQVIQKEGGNLIHNKPVTNILTAIGINDRFTFIRELFNNDSASFEDTMKTLNEAPNFNEAYNFMIQRFGWDMDSETVQGLLDIIRRKFITGKNE